jgi:hypothetical protein
LPCIRKASAISMCSPLIELSIYGNKEIENDAIRVVAFFQF